MEFSFKAVSSHLPRQKNILYQSPLLARWSISQISLLPSSQDKQYIKLVSSSHKTINLSMQPSLLIPRRAISQFSLLPSSETSNISKQSPPLTLLRHSTSQTTSIQPSFKMNNIPNQPYPHPETENILNRPPILLTRTISQNSPPPPSSFQDDH